MQKMKRRGGRGLKYDGNERQTGTGQRQSEMEKDSTGRQGPQRAVELQEGKEENNNNKNINLSAARRGF
jgi:hypothetical protein